MCTISAAFAAKIKTLNGYYFRALYGGSPPLVGADVITTISSVVQTLQSILKEVPGNLLDMLKNVNDDQMRLGLFPSLDYKGLYNALIQLLDICSLIQGNTDDLCRVFLQCVGQLMPFLDRDCLNTLPYHIAYSLCIFSSDVHKDIVEYLTFYILPFTVDIINKDYVLARANIPAVMMLVFQYCDSLCYQRLLLESLMALQRNLVEDILCIIAHGTSCVRLAATRFFLCYWPTFCSSLYERRAGIPDDVPPYHCQSKICNSLSSSVASKVCYNINIAAKYSIGKPAPLYVCNKCAYEIQREQKTEMRDILRYVQMGSVVCENKKCQSKETEKTIAAICFSLECASHNNNHPIYYCKQCHKSIHTNKGYDHIVHVCLPQAWNMDPIMRTYLVESVVSLLKEARPSTPEVPKDLTDLQSKAAYFNVMTEMNMIPIDDRQLMGRFGVWLLIGLCKPKWDTPKEIVGRLLSILFHWFHVTAYSFDAEFYGLFTVDQAECTLEELKSEHVRTWLSEVNGTHFAVFMSCLLPLPLECMRVSGHWDMWLSSTLHLKNGLNRLFSLVPYELITQEIWNSVMPHWLDAVTKDVPVKELNHFKMLFSKILDPDMSFLGFDTKRLYQFITMRFKNPTIEILEQSLSWIQVLTLLEIAIPLHMLFSFLENGTNSLTATITEEQKYESDESSGILIDKILKYDGKRLNGEPHIRCCVLMLDITLRQIKLHHIDVHSDASNSVIHDISRILKDTLFIVGFYNRAYSNNSNNATEISGNSVHNYSALWYQFSSILLEYIVPPSLGHSAHTSLNDLCTRKYRTSPIMSDKRLHKSDTMMAATVETVVEQLDLAPLILTERVIPAVARAITFTESLDMYGTAIQSSHPYIFSNETFERNFEYERTNDWKEFQFSFEELPPQLQYTYMLLKELSETTHHLLRYYILQSLYLTILKGEFLPKLMRDRRCFVYWNKKTDVINQLWELCASEHSHISELSAPVLLYCITLPSGFDTYSGILHSEFNNDSWKIRFLAVEKATVVLRFIDAFRLKKNIFVQTALAHTFSLLILAINDINEVVAQRATLYLGSIHDDAIKLFIRCLEIQFDNIAADRTIILRCLYQLHNSLSDRKILTWDFFHSRFEICATETQLKYKSMDRPFFKDNYAQLSIRLNVIRNNLQYSTNRYLYTEEVINLEEINRETVHLLIFLFMEFISRSDQAYPTDEKVLSRMQKEVFRHLCTQIGCNFNEQYFYIPSRILRTTPSFNAFLSNVAQFLDQNYKLGTMFVPNVVYILQYCVCPNHNGMFNFQSHPSYSLWSLESHARRCWLTSLLVFCYKYDYKKLPLNAYVIPLIKIVLNTLSNHLHLCNQIPPAIVMYSFDQSLFSQETIQKIPDSNSAPTSPGINIKMKKPISNMETHWEEDPKKRSIEIAPFSNGSYESDDDEDDDNDVLILPSHLHTEKTPVHGWRVDYKCKKHDTKLSGEVKLKNNLKVCNRASCVAYRKNTIVENKDAFEYMSTYPSTSSMQILHTPSLSSNDKCLRKSLSFYGTTLRQKRKRDFDSDYVNTTELTLPALERLLPIGKSSSQVDSSSSHVRSSCSEIDGGSSTTTLIEKDTKNEACACFQSAVIKNIHKHPSAFLRQLRTGNTIPKNFNELCHSTLNLEQQNDMDEDCVHDRCSQCGTIREEYSCEELGLCIVVLGTFIHKEPSLAAPMLDSILSLIARISAITVYSWQGKNNVGLPGGVIQVSRQFLRIVLHQFAPNGIFTQIFLTPMNDITSRQFFKTIVQALVDFQQLSPVIPLVILLEAMNSKKTFPSEKINMILYNMSNYLDCLLTELVPVTWTTLMGHFDTFFHRIALQLETFDDLTPILKNMKVILKIPNIVSFKGVLEPFSKILSYGLRNFGIPFMVIRDICSSCANMFSREKERLMLTRVAAFELVQALRFKVTLPTPCVLALTELILQDYGTTLVFPYMEIEAEKNLNTFGNMHSGITEVMRQYHGDILDFITDFHTLMKVRSNYRIRYHGLNDDTLGGLLKAALSQYVTLELVKGNSRESSNISRMLPWVYTFSQNQQITWEFSERANHIRLLCWLLHGALTNYYILDTPCLAPFQEISCSVISEIQNIFNSFPDYSKASVVFTSSLFYCFIFCQLWTVCLEQEALCHKPGSEQYNLVINILFDFWSKITPFMLKLASHSKTMADTVNLHFINIIEALLECHSSVLTKLLPLWNPVFKFYKMQITKQVNFRLQKCLVLPSLTYVPLKDSVERNTILKWLHCLQFKMSQVELQACQGTQFYTI